MEERVSYVLLDAELQTPVLDHVDAVVFVPRPEQTFALLQLDEDHVATELQEQRLLKVTQHPAEVRRSDQFCRITGQRPGVGVRVRGQGDPPT